LRKFSIIDKTPEDRVYLPFCIDPLLCGDPWQESFCPPSAVMSLPDCKLVRPKLPLPENSHPPVPQIPKHLGDAYYLTADDLLQYPTPDLNLTQRLQLLELMLKFKMLFPSNLKELGHVNDLEFEITLKPDAKLPPVARSWNLAPMFKDQSKDCCQCLLCPQTWRRMENGN